MSRQPVRFADEYEKYYQCKPVVVAVAVEVEKKKETKAERTERILSVVSKLPGGLTREVVSFVPEHRRSGRVSRPPVRFADQHGLYYK